MKYTRPAYKDPSIKMYHKTSAFRPGGYDVPIVNDRRDYWTFM